MMIFSARSIIAAAFVAWAGTMVLNPGSIAFAQTPAAKPGPKLTTPQAQTGQAPDPNAQQPAPPPTPIRTETTAFDAWTVTCREFAEPKLKKSCVAQIQVTQSNSGQIVLLWSIGVREDRQLEGVLRVPTGVNIAQGVDLKIGNSTIRKLVYSTCEPQYCTMNTQIDAAWHREMAATETYEFTIYGSGGNNIKLNIPAKGADKALAALLLR